MITARYAIDQNRKVFAVPGNISSQKSNGTNLLIRTDRARLTQSPKDVLEAMGYQIAAEGVITDNEKLTEGLTAFEHVLFDALDGEPTHPDVLCEKTGLASNEVLIGLLGLEFKGMVRQLAGKMFMRA